MFFIRVNIISIGNKLLDEIFDERKYNEKMSDYCLILNNEHSNRILQIDNTRKIFLLTYAFKKPIQNFIYNYKSICPYELSKIIQTFSTSDTDIVHFLFIFSNENK